MTTVAELLAGRADDLPQPGDGHTAERFDARSIICEAGRQAPPASTYAVWAAGGPDPATLDERGRLTGSKHWCSGASLVDRALVTVAHAGAHALVDVPISAPGVTLGTSTWRSPAFADVDTRTVHFDLDLGPADMVAVDDWYLRRPGFWHGAIGVAACWAGCVDGVVRRLAPRWPDEPHARAHLGAIDSALWSMRAGVRAAAAEIDAGGPDGADDRQRRALRVRHLVDAAVADITARIGRAVGPGPLAHEPDLHLALAETDLYRRQCHAERDLESLGRLFPA